MNCSELPVRSVNLIIYRKEAMPDKKFVTAINCMDGRVQEGVIRWLKDRYQADYVDVITAPGPVKILGSGEPEHMLASILSCLKVSAEKHCSPAVAVVAHHDCAGNPVSKEEQIKQLFLAERVLRKTHPSLEVVLLWVDENWQVQEIKADSRIS